MLLQYHCNIPTGQLIIFKKLSASHWVCYFKALHLLQHVGQAAQVSLITGALTFCELSSHGVGLINIYLQHWNQLFLCNRLSKDHVLERKQGLFLLKHFRVCFFLNKPTKVTWHLCNFFCLCSLFYLTTDIQSWSWLQVTHFSVWI